MIEVRDLECGYEIENDLVKFQVVPEGYVSGIERGTFTDKRTGAVELGSGCDICDFLLEPVSDPPDSTEELVYKPDLPSHGRIPKRYVEGGQVCTQSKKIDCELVRGDNWVAIHQWTQWWIATYGRQPGSRWDQWIVLADGARWVYSMDKVTTVNDNDHLILRIDLPGHLHHYRGERSARVYLSYDGLWPIDEFYEPFPPDAKHWYQRAQDRLPERMIRAYQTQVDGKPSAWLAGMTLAPEMVWEGWCHSRGYRLPDGSQGSFVCFIQEIGGVPIKAGQSFSAAYVIGWFDTIAQMEATYDRHRGARELVVTDDGWALR